MIKPSTELDKAISFSFEELRRHADNVAHLPIELQTVVRVVSAGGVIGNGGLKYFFERDWVGMPPYEEFVNAFRAIGANEIADSIEGVVRLLGPSPHLDRARRWSRFGGLWSRPRSLVKKFDDPVSISEVCQKTDALLERFVAEHRSAFVKD